MKRHRRKKAKIEPANKIDTNKDLSTRRIRKNRLIFTYYEGEGEVTTYNIIPYHKSENFLEGFCLDTKETKSFKIKDIAAFLEETRPIFDSLKRDPSILRKEEYLASEEERKQRGRPKATYKNPPSPGKSTATVEYKEHKKWNEDNPTEIFFRYRNASGRTRNRVVQLINYNAEEIQGFCKIAKGLRTFKFDRIQIFYKDSKERLEAFRTNPHFNRDILAISFIGFDNSQFEEYKRQGAIYNYRALKTITKNTALIVVNKELTPSQQDKAEQYGCAFVLPEDFSHFLETGEVQSIEYQESDDNQKEERESLNSDRDFEGFDIYNDPYIETEAKANRNNPEVITFIYTKKDSNGKVVAKQERAINPYYRNDERLEGYCLDENERRAFWIDRIEKFTGNSKRVFDQMD